MKKSRKEKQKSENRFKVWLSENSVTQKAVAEWLDCTSEYINALANGRRKMTLGKAKQIEEYSHKLEEEFGVEPISATYLLGLDNFKNEKDFINCFEDFQYSKRDLLLRLIALHGYEIIERRGEMKKDVETGKEYRDVKYGIKTKEAVYWLEIGEINKRIDEIDSFIDFKFSFELDKRQAMERNKLVVNEFAKQTGAEDVQNEISVEE